MEKLIENNEVDSTINRLTKLESSLKKQKRTIRCLTMALLVALYMGASNFQWVEKAWAAVGDALKMDTANNSTFGIQTSLTSPVMGNTFFVKNEYNSSSAVGMKAESTQNGTGLWGKSTGGNGVIGEASGNAGKAGVYGFNSSTSTGGQGIYGEARAYSLNHSYGVFGYHTGTASAGSVNAAGVFGDSINAYGVKGHSDLKQGGVFSSANSSDVGQIRLISAGSVISGSCGANTGALAVGYEQFGATRIFFCADGGWRQIALTGDN